MDPHEFENKYFIDSQRHNCPFCGVRSIGYSVVTQLEVDWTKNKKAYIYTTECFGCRNHGFHISFYNFSRQNRGSHCFNNPPYVYMTAKNEDGEDEEGNFSVDPKGNPVDLDAYDFEPDPYFIYHRPSSKFSIDPNVPEKIRDLVEEAEGCKNQNFMVGASGALRKSIYEFLLDQKIPKYNEDEDKTEISYAKRIKMLKEKYPKAEGEVFDALASIQSFASEDLHEDDDGNWKPWSSVEFEFVLEVVKSALYEVYAARQKILSMMSRIKQLRQGVTEKNK